MTQTDIKTYPNEDILDDSYPVHAGYAYVADGHPRISDVSGSVLTLKRDLGASEIRRCNLAARSEDAS